MLRKGWSLLFAVMLAVQAPVFAELSSKAKKAEKLIGIGDVAGAFEIYRELMDKNAGKNPELVKEGREGAAKCRVLEAKGALKNDDYSGAEKTLREVIADYKDTAALKDAFAVLVQVRATVCAALIDGGKYDECIALVKDTRTLVPADTDGLKGVVAFAGKALFAAGSASLQAKDYAKALSSFAAVGKADLSADDPIIAKSSGTIAKIGIELLSVAESQIKAGKYEDAVKNTALALTAGGDEAFVAQAKYDTGLASRLNNQPDKAFASYKEVLDNYKTTVFASAAAYDMYLMNRDKGNRKDALACITAASNLDAGNIDYQFIRAGLLNETDAPEEAKKVYGRLVEILQDRVQKTYAGKEKFQYRLGQAYMGLESYSEAAVEFNKAVIRDPSYTEARKGLAAAQFKDRNYADAAQNYEMLIKQSSSDYDKLRGGAGAASQNAESAESAQQLEKLGVQIAYYHYQNGLCYEQMSNYDKAEQECRLGLEGVSTKEAAATMKRIQQARAQKPVPAQAPAASSDPVSQSAPAGK